ncbi:hypothetical protein [Cellulomonas chengniuliangii]|uniref:Uncharacterized protein n=1 Tax=Cellulomonas chengniuliangii TaxID=2968084 RepID=A0ABY5L4F8_9CELL|nr:hypothetical protein [Cellulomonas chengniuliangii]MCC2307770.1 hypothetical protein [Cellulomonas chengniuliangii]UUI75473.1 hypothetical protein NP064_00630 [Cellulomonas chengniuliangii]
MEIVETVDVAGIWESQLEARAGTGPPSSLGPRGWTLPAVEVLAPFTTSAHVPWAYHDYRPLGSRRTVHEVNGDDGLVRFAGLGAEGAQRLLDLLTPAQLATTQRDSPTLGAALRAAVRFPGVVEVHGYAAGPAHDDERITAEGVFLYALPDLHVPGWPHDGACDCTTLWEAARDRYGLDDARGMPQELQRRTNRWRPGEHCWQLTWD